MLGLLRTGYRITLNLSGLKAEDVLELLYRCGGQISHLEIFNLKDYTSGKSSDLEDIYALQRAINDGNVIRLKRVIRRIIERVETSSRPDASDRVEALTDILRNIGSLRDFYRDVPIKLVVGSDSTGRSSRVPGMGLAVLDSLPYRAQRELKRSSGAAGPRLTHKNISRVANHLHTGDEHQPLVEYLLRGFTGVSRTQTARFVRAGGVIGRTAALQLDPHGNVISLGGIREEWNNGLALETPARKRRRERLSWTYLNTGLKNAIKVLVGFLPAFATFYLTKDWWVLAYFGAVIWFGITGLRNIVQSVLGGGGIRRSPRAPLEQLCQLERLADSLFFTVFVPLLDYVIKTLLLDRGLGVTTATSPALLYTVMALANGLYLASHNAFRGLPRSAIYGNLFRSILSIPLAVGFNDVLAGLMSTYAWAGADAILQKWAAVISKAASDCVAGVIEGLADRYENMRRRVWDYSGKLTQLFDTFSRLELLYPEVDVLEMLGSPQKFLTGRHLQTIEMERIMIVNSIDLLYFWMYQPRAHMVLKIFFAPCPRKSGRFWSGPKPVLQREKDISQMFVDGLVGRKFSKALAFYLNRSEEYLRALEHLSKCTPFASSAAKQSAEETNLSGSVPVSFRVTGRK